MPPARGDPSLRWSVQHKPGDPELQKGTRRLSQLPCGSRSSQEDPPSPLPFQTQVSPSQVQGRTCEL